MTVLEGRVVGNTVAPPKGRAIFGRDPVLWVMLIEGIVGFLVLFPVAEKFGITQQSAVLIVAFVSALAGAYTAWATRDTGLGAVTGAAKAGAGLLGYYVGDFTAEQQMGLVVFVTVLVAFYQRTQTTPVDFPLNPSPTQVVQTEDVPAALPVDGEPEAVGAGLPEQVAPAVVPAEGDIGYVASQEHGGA